MSKNHLLTYLICTISISLQALYYNFITIAMTLIKTVIIQLYKIENRQYFMNNYIYYIINIFKEMLACNNNTYFYL